MSVSTSNFTVDIRHVLQEIQGVLYELINMKITIIEGEYPVLSGIEYLVVRQGTLEVTPSIIRYSADQKELHAGFPVGAFAGMTGTAGMPGIVFITFGFGNQMLGGIDGVPLIITPLSSIYSPASSNSSILV